MELTVVGCGLTGSHIPYPLGSSMSSAPWSATVNFVDFDIVEPRNAPATLPTKSLVGNISKSKFVSARAEEHGIHARGFVNKVTANNVESSIGTPTLIIGAVDNDDVRLIMLLYAQSKNIPYIDIGVNEFSGRVSWSFGNEVNTHPFSPQNIRTVKHVEKEKLPPCTLYGTRKHAVMVVENAVQSIATFLAGHDPHDIALKLLGRTAERGDMIGWTLSEEDGVTKISPHFAGSVKI